MSFLRGGKYSYKPSKEHRSGLEDKIADQIKAHGTYAYEQYEVHYVVPASNHVYTPDFVLQNGVVIEAKGLFDSDDRKKHLIIKKQFPDLEVRFVFQAPRNKIYKGSKTTYADWCEKNGFLWATKLIPREWFKEAERELPACLKVKRKKVNKK